MSQNKPAPNPTNPFDSDDWRSPLHKSVRVPKLDSVVTGTPLALEDTIDLMGEDIRRLTARIAALEEFALQREQKIADLLAQFNQAIHAFSASATSPESAPAQHSPIPKESQFRPVPQQTATVIPIPTPLPLAAPKPEVESGIPEMRASGIRGLRRGFDEEPTPPPSRPSQEFSVETSNDNETGEPDFELSDSQKLAIQNVEPVELQFPDEETEDWNVWLETWIQAEQRAAVLGESGVPQMSAVMFSPGAGSNLLDTWNSLCAGRQTLVESLGNSIKDEQINNLIQLTLKVYNRELDKLRKQSGWYLPFMRAYESLKALGAIAQGETRDALIRAEDHLEAWYENMDASAQWFSSGDGYGEEVALSFALLYDKLCDRPGSRQSQFSIENQTDMVVYNSTRGIELFLAKMNVQRDKELLIGKPVEQLMNLKNRDNQLQKKTNSPVPARPVPGQKIARIIRNRWYLTGGAGREVNELVKPGYELES